MIAILLDQGLALQSAVLLRQRGLDEKHVSEIAMSQADDVEILEAARTSDRVCVTLDHDFHTHLAVAGHGRPSVIFLRVEGLGAEAQADLIEFICTKCKAALEEGVAISADRENIVYDACP